MSDIYHEGNTEGYSPAQLKRMNSEAREMLRGVEPGSDQWHERVKHIADRHAGMDFGSVVRPSRFAHKPVPDSEG